MNGRAADTPYGKRMQPKPGRMTEHKPQVSEVHILWITAGLGCDGDSVSITAATQPSIEDVLLGAIPGLPKVHLHNPVLAYEVGDEFMKLSCTRRRGASSIRFVLVVEGSIPNEKIKRRRLLGGLRYRPRDRSADHDLRMDRPAGAQGAGGCRGRHLRHLWRHPRHEGQSHRMHGPGRLSRLELEIEGRPSHRERAGLPGAAGQFHGDACSICCTRLPGLAPDDPARRGAAAELAVRENRA